MTPQDWLARSARELETSRSNLAMNPDAACSRAYYAMFYAARAGLIQVGQDGGKTHSGLIAAFGKHLVMPGFVAAEHGRAFGIVADMRAAADYDGMDMSRAGAERAINQASVFVSAVKEWIAMRAA